MSPHAPPHGLAYVEIGDVAAGAKKVRELGGKVHMEPTAMEKVGTFAIVGERVPSVGIEAFGPRDRRA